MPDNRVRRRLLIGQWITFSVFFVAVLGSVWWFQESGVLEQTAALEQMADLTTPALLLVLTLPIATAAVLVRIGLDIWILVVAYKTKPVQTTVWMADVRGVKASLNYSMLWWVLLIGPFALIPLFMGRRNLRLELPPTPDGSAPARGLRIRELSIGDAKAMETWLREGGAS